MTVHRTLLPGVFLAVVLLGCAHAPVAVKKAGPDEQLRSICEVGRELQKARGTVWLKVSSKEVSGQFPATIEISAPDALVMEVTNLLGGREALITIRGKQYTVDVPPKKGRSQAGTRTWGGIPLEWAAELFLGRFPCPPSDAIADSAIRWTDERTLEVDVPPNLSREAQRFVYRVQTQGDRLWPEALHWERKNPPKLEVDFTFANPESDTHSPRRWEAKSPQGEVKVRWKDRQLPR
ncbi:MAG: hypothetical protein NDJ90_04835 [Oligoflexia bacterium]|nr:hypothetical protein [Oligoflexia bacterium]